MSDLTSMRKIISKAGTSDQKITDGDRSMIKYLLAMIRLRSSREINPNRSITREQSELKKQLSKSAVKKSDG